MESEDNLLAAFNDTRGKQTTSSFVLACVASPLDHPSASSTVDLNDHVGSSSIIPDVQSQADQQSSTALTDSDIPAVASIPSETLPHRKRTLEGQQAQRMMKRRGIENIPFIPFLF